MAESFANKSVRRVGVTSSVTTALVDTSYFIGGTRVTAVNTASNFGIGGSITVDSTSTNVSAAVTQTVGFHSMTAIDTPTEKTILVAGTLANNTANQVTASVVLEQHNNESINVVHDVPIPSGSSLVLSDAGKLVVGVGSTLAVAVDANQGVDVAFSFLRGVS